MLIKGFSPEWLEELKQRNDILEVVSRYVTMERKGGKYWGRCPFHHEKTPSFTVSSDRGFFHCFGCHESGDVISFITKIENIDFFDSISFLASRAGMKVPELKDVNAKNSREEKDRLLTLMKDAARFYHGKLNTTPQSLKYLEKRGISKQTIVKFGIGQSPDFYAIITDLKAKGYTDKQLIDSGVATDKNGRLYDSLGGRLIIPIFDNFGKVVAFGGRALEKNEFAKYKNTRETSIFVKNKVLYGLNYVNKLRQSQKIEDLIIVEGYMDTIALVQAGIENVVASMGTSLTEQQARLIKNHVDNVYICYDGDAAGQASALRGMDILKTKGLNVKVISLPEGLDPDEVISKYGVKGFLEYKEKALPLIEYKLSRAEVGFDFSSPDGRSGYAKRALLIIADLDEVERDVYLDLIAKKSGINKDTLIKGKELISKEKTKEVKTDIKSSAYMDACRFVLLSKLASKQYAKESFARDILRDDTHIKIYDYLKECEANGISPHPSMIYELDGNGAECAMMLNYNPKIQKPEEKRYYEDCLAKIKIEHYGNLINALTEEYNTAEDSKTQSEILQKISELNQNIRR